MFNYLLNNLVTFAAKKLNATAHCPRIGFGLPNFNWYGVERVLKKCLTRLGIATNVYYYKRHQQGSAISPMPLQSPTSANKQMQNVFPVCDNEDVFEGNVQVNNAKRVDVHVYLHMVGSEKVQETAKYKKWIVLHGGIVLNSLNHDNCTCVLTNADNADADSLLQAQHAQHLIVKCSWIDDCLKHGKLLDMDAYKL